ncbi:MAG: hypothetical protein J5966_05335 [Lachnospiraceae bacterium]|nr:hypothetical protein [Lachnospiraceae bacterium]
MLINCSNHPYEIWSELQKEAAAGYGKVMEIPFPQIDPVWDSGTIRRLASEYAGRIERQKPDAVFVAGEFIFTFMLVDKLLSDGVKVIASCSRRVTEEIKKEDGTNEKKSVFRFEGFREYEYFEERRQKWKKI